MVKHVFDGFNQLMQKLSRREASNDPVYPPFRQAPRTRGARQTVTEGHPLADGHPARRGEPARTSRSITVPAGGRHPYWWPFHPKVVSPPLRFVVQGAPRVTVLITSAPNREYCVPTVEFVFLFSRPPYPFWWSRLRVQIAQASEPGPWPPPASDIRSLLERNPAERQGYWSQVRSVPTRPSVAA